LRSALSRLRYGGAPSRKSFAVFLFVFAGEIFLNMEKDFLTGALSSEAEAEKRFA